MPKLMLSMDAWMAALYEDGPGLVADICERVYATGGDLVDLAEIRAVVASGGGAAALAALPPVEPFDAERLRASIDGIVSALTPTER